MGYLLTTTIFRPTANLNALRSLPASIGYTIYAVGDWCLLDSYRAGKKSRYPFTTMMPTADLPLELTGNLQGLGQLYEILGRPNGFKRAHINFSRLASDLLNDTVLTFVSDDDSVDFACIATAGELKQMLCRCDDLQIEYANGQITIVPLVDEETEGAEEFQTDLHELRGTIPPSVELLNRTTPRDNLLHRNALKLTRQFAPGVSDIIGLGTFDPPDVASRLKTLAER